jgi:signal recognition particle receptor subunit beta
MTIIFSGMVTIGKEKFLKHVNEKSIVEISSPKQMDFEIDNCSEGSCGIVIHV